MNKILVLAFLTVPLITLQSCSSTVENPHENVKQTVLQCNNCHSATASTSATQNTPLLGGMDEQYLMEQLDNFRVDKRGAGSVSAATQEMSRQVKALQDDELRYIANYYAALPTVDSTETVAGDINNGKALYATNCKGCHSSAIGRFFTDSPKISHLKGPYIFEQLTLFAADKRNFNVENKHKNKMVEVSKLFNSKELSDITAYIKSK
ncbi:c-type cytochrome [Moritella dasanensis]|uniref:c-type cytochrome n=1 Tax=Moritella dasanensis TaxID=428031 RepID=UPI0002FEC148|nr:c-type cytochrome [Moritella dasanensis]